MQAISKDCDTSSTSLGQRRGISDLARFALDLTWATTPRAESETPARPRDYPSPPMSGSPPLPPKANQEVGDRGQQPHGSSYPPISSQDAYRGGPLPPNTQQGDIRGPPPPHPPPQSLPPPPAPRPYHPETDRMAYSYPRPDDHMRNPPSGYAHMASQALQQRPPPYMQMPGPPPPPQHQHQHQHSYPAPMPQPPQESAPYTSPKAQRKTKGHVASACVPCKRAHLRCDGWPERATLDAAQGSTPRPETDPEGKTIPFGRIIRRNSGRKLRWWLHDHGMAQPSKDEGCLWFDHDRTKQRRSSASVSQKEEGQEPVRRYIFMFGCHQQQRSASHTTPPTDLATAALVPEGSHPAGISARSAGRLAADNRRPREPSNLDYGWDLGENSPIAGPQALGCGCYRTLSIVPCLKQKRRILPLGEQEFSWGGRSLLGLGWFRSRDDPTQRPCSRCTSNGKEDACVDVQHKKRGRPRLRDDREGRYGPSTYPHPQDTAAAAAARRPLSLYSSGGPISGYDDPIRRSHSYRVLKSQPSEPLPPRYLERASPADANLYAPPLTAAAVPGGVPEPVVFLTMELDIARASQSFADAIGIPNVRGRKLSDIVIPSEREKVQSYQRQMQDERARKEPNYLPPIFGQHEQERVFESLRFETDEIARFQLDRQDFFAFASIDGQLRSYPIRMGLAKQESIYFIVLLLNAHPRYPYPSPSPHARDIPYSSYQQQPPPQQQAYAQHTPVSATFEPARPRFGESALAPRPSPGQPPHMTSGLSPGVSPGMPSYAASPSRPDYPVGPSSYQIPRSELPPTTRPPQPSFQLPPIRAGPHQPPQPEPSWQRDDRSGRVDIGGLLENPDPQQRRLRND